MMIQYKSIVDVIFTTDWGNKSSKKIVHEFSDVRNGLHSIVKRATKCTYEEASMRDTDYHVLGANLFNGLSHKKLRMSAAFMNETIN